MLHGGSMKNICILAFSALLLISCENNEKKDDTAIRAGEELNLKDNRPFNDDEFELSKKICRALEEKNVEIQRMIGFSKRFTFARSKKYCGQDEFQLSDFGASLTAPSNLGETPEFKSATNSNQNIDDFLYKVFVENDYVIKTVCEKVLSQGKKPNIIEPLDSYQVKYRFYSSDKLELAVYSVQDGKWMPYRFDVMTVELDENSERYGMLRDRHSGAYCRTNNQDISFIRQVLR